MNDKTSIKIAGMSGPVPMSDEQKQVDTESGNNSSIPSHSNFFSIFNKSNAHPKATGSELEQGTKKRSIRTTKKPPPD